MSPPDSSEIDNALIGLLLADATLAGMMPDGVYYDEAKAGATRFVIVSVLTAFDLATFGRRAIEDVMYLVKAVALSSTGGDVKGAAARIDTLLEDTQALVVTGYGLMTVHRMERLRHTEVDAVNPDLRWQHRGGHYRVQVTPT